MGGNGLLPCGCVPLAGPIGHCLSENYQTAQWYSLNLIVMRGGEGGWVGCLGWGGVGRWVLGG